MIHRRDPAVPVALLVAALYLGPEHLSDATGWRQPAVEYITAGLEAGALWLAGAALLWGRYTAVPCVWAASEAFMRAGCRAMLPLDRPLTIAPDQNLCEAAIGLHMGWVSLLLAALTLAVAAETLRGARDDHGHARI